jgi:hypothetical protein
MGNGSGSAGVRSLYSTEHRRACMPLRCQKAANGSRLFRIDILNQDKTAVQRSTPSAHEGQKSVKSSETEAGPGTARERI